ncbi:hypothetical protein A8990_117108 [Paenibacillus taihuensis]|uniref:Uncharacterized protein n=1 Tax=Paenibacillus taihuensis TaxID=1156355 RepID=A0A3D9S272_9BACL|nr:hypothetical protein A8990_117108 [Paenibacillus taihuensis]
MFGKVAADVLGLRSFISMAQARLVRSGRCTITPTALTRSLALAWKLPVQSTSMLRSSSTSEAFHSPSMYIRNISRTSKIYTRHSLRSPRFRMRTKSILALRDRALISPLQRSAKFTKRKSTFPNSSNRSTRSRSTGFTIRRSNTSRRTSALSSNATSIINHTKRRRFKGDAFSCSLLIMVQPRRLRHSHCRKKLVLYYCAHLHSVSVQTLALPSIHEPSSYPARTDAIAPSSTLQ